MKTIILVSFLITIQSYHLYPQQLSFKTGIGISSIYQTNENNYYRNKLMHETDPNFILLFRINWHLSDKLYIAWEPGVIEKHGKITGEAAGYDNNYNDIYAYNEYKLWNIDNSIFLNYDLFSIKNIIINIYFGPGLSWNISEEQTTGISKFPISHYYTDYPVINYENTFYVNNTGPYINTGINIQFNMFQLDLRYIREYSNLKVGQIGLYKSDLFVILLGYEIY